MTNKRDGWDKVSDDVNSGPLGTYKWFIIFFVGVALVVGGYYAISKPGKMLVDRIATKQSLQYKEGMAKHAAVLEANIMQINADIAACMTDCEGLQLQKKAFESQLNAIKINE